VTIVSHHNRRSAWRLLPLGHTGGKLRLELVHRSGAFLPNGRAGIGSDR
jgi:hypothetical protein